MKKKISYSITLLFFVLAFLMVFYKENIFPQLSPAASELGETIRTLNILILAAIPIIIGIIFFVFAFIQKENEGNQVSKNLSPLYKPLNPIISLTIGFVILLGVYFNIADEHAINYFASIAGGLIFAFGLGGLIRKIIKKGE